MRVVTAKALGALMRFRRAREGAAAVEFALIAAPFFLLTFALAEVTLIGFAQTSLDFAVSETSRRIRIGEVQTQGLTAADLRADMCETMNWVLDADCEGALFLDVDRYTSFVGVNAAAPIQDGNFDSSDFGFNPGQPSDIVLVRSFYRWEMITPFFSTVFANVSSGERVLNSTMMFRNEPYPVGDD